MEKQKELYDWWKSARGLLYPLAMALVPIVITQLEAMPITTKVAAWVIPIVIAVLKVIRDKQTHPSN